MARLVVLYDTPADPAAFDRYYFETHIPIAKTIPGLLGYDVSRGPVVAPGGASGVHLVAILHFADLAAVQAAFASPEGQATAADLANFAAAGVKMMFFDHAEV